MSSPIAIRSRNELRSHSRALRADATDQDQWRRAHYRCRPANAAFVDDSRHHRAHRNQIRLRLHRSFRWRGGPLLSEKPCRCAGARGRDVIEGLNADRGHPVQRAWEAKNVPQCGYCHAGQIMQAVALRKQTPPMAVACGHRQMSFRFTVPATVERNCLGQRALVTIKNQRPFAKDAEGSPPIPSYRITQRSACR